MGLDVKAAAGAAWVDAARTKFAIFQVPKKRARPLDLVMDGMKPNL